MAGGGSPPAQSAAYPTYALAIHEAMVGNSSALQFNLVDALNYARTFNPYTVRSPYNPTSSVNDLLARLTKLNTDIDALDPDTDVESYIDQAVSKYDSAFGSGAILDDVVDAHDNATEAAFQRRVSAGEVGMWGIGAYMNSQLAVGTFLYASDRAYEMAELSSRIRLSNFQIRVQTATGIADMMLRERLAVVQSKQVSVSSTFDAYRFAVAALGDYEEQGLNYDLRKVTWDMVLLNDGQPIFSSIFGVPTVPRALTGGERLAARIGGAIQTGLNFGAATSPGAGVLAGIASLGISLVGDNLK